MAKPDAPEISLPISATTQAGIVDFQRLPDPSHQLMHEAKSTYQTTSRSLPTNVDSHILHKYNDFILKSDEIIFRMMASEKLDYKKSVEFQNYSDEIVSSLINEMALHTYKSTDDKKIDTYPKRIYSYIRKISKNRDATLSILEKYIAGKKQSDIESLDKLDRLEILSDFAQRHSGEGLIEFMSHLFPEWISPQERDALVQQMGQPAKRLWTSKVTSELSGILTEPMASVPQSAPAIWKDNKLAGDTPPDFIKRHYAPWLKSDATGLTRPDIKRLDPSLYMALANWLRKNELPGDCPVPIKSQRLDSELARVAEGGLASVVSGDDPATILKDAQRLLSAKRRRER